MSKTFAKWFDFFMTPLEKTKFKFIRQNLLIKAKGLVLEIGSGTGINFPYYSGDVEVIAIEPSQDMIERSKKRKDRSDAKIQIHEESAEMLPYEDGTFDTVVATLVLCTIPNPEISLKEMKRVCKDGGRILVFEHVKMDNPLLYKMQKGLTPYWKRICDGCCLDRDTEKTIKEVGFDIVDKKEFYNGLFVQLELAKTY
ncbi:Ubiquinone/menaquinone biosynthesis C-methylase UbiE [Bacillus sp. OV322]|uniref:class I SAM-dependent methyltransferase n=1 Tax=Bacillus sp. OV322 TaxID=1882764 RepID=UPI0008E5111B|nr:class I SAM-dependent methyltransferase [Bacillus sp. OV322]SFB98817.1 Ubiquinone/menaquinone biosynthesis C-methylase UbiE [Bacillus sp. OV322]